MAPRGGQGGLTSTTGGTKSGGRRRDRTEKAAHHALGTDSDEENDLTYGGGASERLAQLESAAKNARSYTEIYERISAGKGSGSGGGTSSSTAQRGGTSTSKNHKTSMTDSSGCSYSIVQPGAFPIPSEPQSSGASVFGGRGGSILNGTDGGDGRGSSSILTSPTTSPEDSPVGLVGRDPAAADESGNNNNSDEYGDDGGGGDGDYCYASGPASQSPPPYAAPAHMGYDNGNGGRGRRCFNTFLAKLEHLVETRFGPLLLLVVVVIGVAVGYTVHVTRNDQPDYHGGVVNDGHGQHGGVAHPHAADMTSEEATARAGAISDVLGEVSDPKLLSNPAKHQFWASQWLIHDDAMVLPADSPYLVQRYVMALLYFELEMDNEIILGDNGQSSDGRAWLSEAWECSWEGVDCGLDSYVTGISGLKGLSGRLPEEISSLESLEMLDLSTNSIHGDIPASLGDMQNLQVLRLEENDIVATIPSGICKLMTAGALREFSTDCDGEVVCSCCTSCGSGGDGASSGISSLPGGFDASAMSAQQRKDAIVDALGKISTPTALKRDGSPQSRAMNWIVDDDEKKLSPFAHNLAQRYIVAVFYYSLHGELWPYLPWLDGTKSECDFYGLACNAKGQIVDISLVSSKLSGTVPEEIKHLRYLEIIDLTGNAIEGPIPDISDLMNLETLLLHENSIVGEVPSSICGLRQHALVDFKVDCDTDTPEVACSCCNNCGYAASKGSFSGISNGVGQTFAEETEREQAIVKALRQHFPNKEPIEEAQHFVVHADPMQLSAKDPKLIQRYVMAIIYFTMGGDRWSIDKPWMESMSDVEDECDFEGVACDGAGNIVGLALDSMNLSGVLPSEISALSSIKAIDMSKNQITGSIPDEFGQLEHLELLILHGNNIRGVVPESICLKRDDAELVVLWVDCSPDDPKVTCSCCTHC